MGIMMLETCWDIVKNKHLLHLVGFLSHFTKYRYLSWANKLLHCGVHRQHQQIQGIFLVVQSSLPDRTLLHTVVITWDRCPSIFVGSKHLQHMPVLKPRNASCPDPLYPPHSDQHGLSFFEVLIVLKKWRRSPAWGNSSAIYGQEYALHMFLG